MTSAPRSRFPPGPDKTFADVIRSNVRQQRSRLTFLRDMAEAYGDIVHFHTGLRDIYFVNHPDLIREVLVEQAEVFHRTRPFKRELGYFLGESLLVTDGAFHRRERRLAQPAFHRKRVEAYAPVMVEHTRRVMETWQPGRPYAIDQEMMKITLGVVAQTLFNADVTGDAAIIWQALTVLQDAVIRRFNLLVRLPAWISTPQRRREQQAIQALDRIIYRIIEGRTSGDGVADDTGDLLSMLMLARDEDGSKMDTQHVRDEVISLFIAGHETTANTLSWTWYLLTQNERVMARLRDEVDSVLGGQMPTLETVEHLPYVGMILKEGLRLYPPAWVISREATNATQLGGYTLEAGAVVVISPYLMHRHPRYFVQPEAFRPERFADGGEKNLPHFAYFPFGGGPHTCLGQGFAMLEGTIILATLAQGCEFRLVSGQTILPNPLITLRARNGIRMTVTRRA